MSSGWYGMLAVAALAAAGCASQSATVTRTPWPSSSHARADSSRAAGGPASTSGGEVVEVPAVPRAAASDSETAAAPGTVDVDMTPPADSGADPYDTTFVSPGRIEEISEKEILQDLPTPPDTARRDTTRRDTARPSSQTSTSSSTARGPLIAPGGTSKSASGGTSSSKPPSGTTTSTSGSTGTPPRPDQRLVWVVQLHASETREAAQFAARQIGRELGLLALVREVEPAAMPFKVIAGNCVDRACADTLRASAISHGYLDAWVTSLRAAEYDSLAGGR